MIICFLKVYIGVESCWAQHKFVQMHYGFKPIVEGLRFRYGKLGYHYLLKQEKAYPRVCLIRLVRLDIIEEGRGRRRERGRGQQREEGEARKGSKKVENTVQSTDYLQERSTRPLGEIFSWERSTRFLAKSDHPGGEEGGAYPLVGRSVEKKWTLLTIPNRRLAAEWHSGEWRCKQWTLRPITQIRTLRITPSVCS